MTDRPAMAEFHVLHTGYAHERVASTVSAIRDGECVVVVDPGMVADRRDILDPLAGLGIRPADVTDVVLSHHHPDHTLNVGLFADARVHDHWAIYRGDSWTGREAEGSHVSPGVRLMATPGHTRQDLTTLVDTAAGVVACTHLWWHDSGPAEDPLAEDPAALHEGRLRVLAVHGLAMVVPGHGKPFRPGPATPR